MQHKRLFSALSKEKPGYRLVVCAVAVFCLSQAALAQSGRRPVRKDSTPPAVSVEAKTESEAKPPAVKPPPVATLIVGGDRLSSSFDIPVGYLDFAINACIERLRRSPSLEVTAGGTSMRKKEAIDEAKKQKDAHVVWLELKVEGDGDPALTVIIIEYTVFIPETGKVKNFGHVYLDRASLGNGRVGLPPSASRRLPLDYLMKEGGRNVAERVMDIFHVSLRD